MASSLVDVSGSTKVYGLIGDPISHTLSPAIQNAAFRFVRLNAVYLAFAVGAAELKLAIHGVKSLGVRGLNVTTPHKEMVLRYLDGVETGAAEIGSINTVKNEDDALIGFNTDGAGAIDAIEEAGESVGGQSVLLFGTGGAGRAIAYSLARRRCSIELANRTLPAARRLAKELRTKFDARVRETSLSKRALRARVVQADIILNASSMGMDAKSPVPVDGKWLVSNQLVFDIVYRPVRTQLLQSAIHAGARTINGLEMLVNQGARSFTLWTGRKAPIHEMRRAIREKKVYAKGS